MQTPSTYNSRYQAGWMSLAIHGGAIALLFTAVSSHTLPLTVSKASRLLVPNLADYMPAPKPSHGGGGGGDGSPQPAGRGHSPKFSSHQFVAPAQVVYNSDPKLLIDPTLIGPDLQLPQNNMDVWGDPL